MSEEEEEEEEERKLSSFMTNPSYTASYGCDAYTDIFGSGFFSLYFPSPPPTEIMCMDGCMCVCILLTGMARHSFIHCRVLFIISTQEEEEEEEEEEEGDDDGDVDDDDGGGGGDGDDDGGGGEASSHMLGHQSSHSMQGF
jgi:hypothetical protein